MRGFVPTPSDTVDWMVARIFSGRPPSQHHTLLDPGCGTGAFVAGVLRWCSRAGLKAPRITGVEIDPRHLPALRERFRCCPTVDIVQADFLERGSGAYDYIIGNPPYVPITGLSEAERVRYRRQFAAARGRFDLYLLFFEQALRQLKPGGRLVFITPEKFLYVRTAEPLREMLARRHVDEIRFVREDTFGKLVTYPAISVVTDAAPGPTHVIRRDGTCRQVRLPPDGRSWLPGINGSVESSVGSVLSDICTRISCGVATGADEVFVRPTAELDPRILPFAHPTVAGRELTNETGDVQSRYSMLIPYDNKGRLLPLEQLGALREDLQRPEVKAKLHARYCAARKPWYALHETPFLADILRPKILCKDICEQPRFWADPDGKIVPRHSVYYIVPQRPECLQTLMEFLRSDGARQWLADNCQRAAKGFLRMQSRTLQRLPIPSEWASRLELPAPSARKVAVQEVLSFGRIGR